jgi:hypothetical protein
MTLSHHEGRPTQAGFPASRAPAVWDTLSGRTPTEGVRVPHVTLREDS